jgi:DNA-binding NarL/FixJ family response regulator
MSYYQFDLTPRQEKILEMMLNGKTNAQIGKELGYAPQSIRNQVSGKDQDRPLSLYRIMGVRDRTQAVVTYLGWRSLRQRGLA